MRARVCVCVYVCVPQFYQTPVEVSGDNFVLSFSLYVGSENWTQVPRLAQQAPLADEPLLGLI